MGLKKYFAGFLKKRKLGNVEKEVKSLIELYNSKLILWNSFSAKKIDESTFKKRFIDLLNADASFLIVEEKLLKNVEDENLKKEMIAWKTAIVKQQNALEKSDYNKLFAGIKEEANLLALENEEIKKLEQELQETKFSKKDIQKNLKELQKLGFKIKIYSDFSLLLAQNWNLTQELIKKIKPEQVPYLLEYGLPAVASLIKSREYLELLVELVGKIKPEYVYILFCYGLPAVASLIKSKEDLKIVGLLLVELVGKIKPEQVNDLFRYGLPAVASLIKSKEDLKIVGLLLVELVGKIKPEQISYLFSCGLPAVASLIKSKEDLKIVGLLLVELVGKIKPEQVPYLLEYGLPAVASLIKSREYLELLVELVGKIKPEQVNDLFRYGLPAVTGLIKSKEDLKSVGILLVVLLNKLKSEDVEVVFKYGLRFIKKISELENIDISELIVRSHALYAKQEESFFSGEKNILRNEFKKTDSRTILLGGKLIGKAIIRIINEPAFLAWKKALESINEWKKEGFDYIPVEPILTKNEELRAFKTKKGEYRVYTTVLGQSLATFLNSSTNEEDKKHLVNLRDKIIGVLNKLKIAHGHTHNSNFCVERKDNKLRLYIIDFDLSTSP